MSSTFYHRWRFRWVGMVCAALMWSACSTSAWASCGDYLRSHGMSATSITRRGSAPLPARRCHGVECQSSPLLPLPTEVPRWTRGWTQSAWWQHLETVLVRSSASPSPLADERYEHLDVDVIEHVPIV